MDSDTSLSQFIELAQEWSIGYSKIVCTYLAFKRDGTWCLEHSITAFFTDLFDEVEKLTVPVTVETDSVLAIRKVIDFNEQHFDRAVAPKTFDPFSTFVDEYKISVPNEVGTKLRYYFEPFTQREFPGNWRWPALTAKSDQNLTNHHLPRQEQLDLELMSHELPYSGVQDLFEAFSIPQTIFQRGYSCPEATWIITHPAIVLDTSVIENETAKIKLKCPNSLNTQDLSVGLRVLTGTPPIVRANVKMSNATWTPKEKWSFAEVEEPVGAGKIADVHLKYKGRYLGHHWIKDPEKSLNPRHALYKLSDSKDVIGATFFDQKPDHFEDSVSLLLNLLGLTAVSYGRIPPLKDAPDILAYSPVGHLFVVECTTGDIGRDGKLLKLSQRTREIREAANQGGIGYPFIIPVIFTTLQKEETKAYWDEAADFGIALVCRENIENLIGRVEAPPTPQQLYDEAIAAIPRKSDQPELPFQAT